MILTEKEQYFKDLVIDYKTPSIAAYKISYPHTKNWNEKAIIQKVKSLFEKIERDNIIYQKCSKHWID